MPTRIKLHILYVLLVLLLSGCSFVGYGAHREYRREAVYYTVQKGDTLYTIAKKYKVEVEQVALLNGKVDVDDAVLFLARFKKGAVASYECSRLATGFRSCKLLNSSRKSAAQAELERILAEPKLSRDVYEIVAKIAAS